MAVSFAVDTMVHGYHEYRSVLKNSVHEEQSSCMRELVNPHDPMAIAIEKSIINLSTFET